MSVETNESKPWKITTKPSRKDLLLVIGHLQGLVGDALAAYRNDRDPNRYGNVCSPLQEAEDLCIQARSFDPAILTKPTRGRGRVKP